MDCPTEQLLPVPVPPMETPEIFTGLECLEQTDPIDSVDGVALHVAMLTGVVKTLLSRIEELENGR